MKHYEELIGGEGRKVFYRAERFLASTLMGEEKAVIEVNGDLFDIIDLSMSGLSFESAKDELSFAGEEENLPVVLMVGSKELFKGKARVIRVEALDKHVKVGIELTTGCLNIQGLIEQHDEYVIERSFKNGLSEVPCKVSSEYKSVISDAVYLLRSTRETLDKFESVLSLRSSRRKEKIDDLIFRCEEYVHQRWKEISIRGMQELEKMRGDQKAIEYAKNYTEKMLTPELMGGASWSRAYMKPLGYPGDFEVMNYAYNLSLIGDTAYEKLCHRLGTSTGEFIAARMIMVRQKIAELTNKACEDGKSDFRVASLGCGPAKEVSTFLEGHVLPVNVHFTLIDQDHDALNCAYSNGFKEASRINCQATVNCLNATFLEFLAAGNLFKKIEDQDFIYAVGLVDYLTDQRAKRLVNDLYTNLNPGGTLMIGSMRHSDKSLEWQVEFVTDWQLVYRDEQEMLDMAVKLPEEASREVVMDSTGHCHVLIVTKPD